jgi:hypothetical protein
MALPAKRMQRYSYIRVILESNTVALRTLPSKHRDPVNVVPAEKEYL